MIPGDRLLCVFVKNYSVGIEFKDWPLHITIVPWFRLDFVAGKFTQELESILGKIQPFAVTMGRENVGFGHQKGKMATLVDVPTTLTEIERDVRDYMHANNAWLVDETTKSTQTFRPHITNQKNSSTRVGDIFFCDRLHIVEQKGGSKKIVGEVRLG